MQDLLSGLQSVYDYRVIGPYLDEFARGTANTLVAAVCSLLLSIVIGGVLAGMRLSGSRVAAAVALAYAHAIRSTPLLLQLYLVYFGLPLLSASLARLPELVLGIAALSLHAGAYMGEIIRSGLASVPRGQREAAIATGMTGLQQYRHVVLPQAIVNIIPSLLGQAAIMVKDTSLLSLITVFDLVSAGMLLNSERVRPSEAFLSIAAVYFAIYLLMLAASRLIEARLAGRGWRGRPA